MTNSSNKIVGRVASEKARSCSTMILEAKRLDIRYSAKCVCSEQETDSAYSDRCPMPQHFVTVSQCTSLMSPSKITSPAINKNNPSNSSNMVSKAVVATALEVTAIVSEIADVGGARRYYSAATTVVATAAATIAVVINCC